MSTQNGSFSFNKTDLLLYIDPSNPRGYDNQFIYDLSYNKGFTFSMNNGATFSLSNNKVFQFDGITSTTASNVATADGVTYTMGTQMTWDVWFKRTNENNMFNMVYSHNLPYLSFRGAGGSNKFLFSWANKISTVPTQQTLFTPLSYSNNIWYNVATTLNHDLISGSCSATIYVNGLFVTSTTILSIDTDSVYQPFGAILIGNYGSPFGGTRYPFTGNIGPLRVWKRILTPSEISESYNSLKSRYGY